MRAPLWTAVDAAAATGGEVRGDWDAVSGVSIDTREIAPGDLFVALTGENREGHAFVSTALTAGAGAAMVSRIPDDVAADAPLLVVDDTLRALERLGGAARARTRARVIAVTGSAGKTSTKDMLRVMLAAQGTVHAAVRSFNNHWGVPLTLARMPADIDWAVIEIGMNHAGEIEPLSKLTRPDVALITTIEPVHLAAFDGIDGIADAKAEIFAGLGPDGVAVLNADIATAGRLAGAAAAHRIVRFGRTADDFTLSEVSLANHATIVRASHAGQPVTFKIGAPGRHLAMNALGALAAVDAAGGDIARAAVSLAIWCPPSGRGERRTIVLGPGGLDGEITLIDDSYNANPASVAAALAVLAETPVAAGRRIAVLGDMLELGPQEEAFHKALAELQEIDAIDRIHCCGPLMKALYDALPPEKRGLLAKNSKALAKALPRAVRAGDVCMVKGSLGSQMAVAVAAIEALGRVRLAGEDEDD